MILVQGEQARNFNERTCECELANSTGTCKLHSLSMINTALLMAPHVACAGTVSQLHICDKRLCAQHRLHSECHCTTEFLDSRERRSPAVLRSKFGAGNSCGNNQ